METAPTKTHFVNPYEKINTFFLLNHCSIRSVVTHYHSTHLKFMTALKWPATSYKAHQAWLIILVTCQGVLGKQPVSPPQACQCSIPPETRPTTLHLTPNIHSHTSQPQPHQIPLNCFGFFSLHWIWLELNIYDFFLHNSCSLDRNKTRCFVVHSVCPTISYFLLPFSWCKAR